jgi:hypothetical protein
MNKILLVLLVTFFIMPTIQATFKFYNQTPYEVKFKFHNDVNENHETNVVYPGELADFNAWGRALRWVDLYVDEEGTGNFVRRDQKNSLFIAPNADVTAYSTVTRDGEVKAELKIGRPEW